MSAVSELKQQLNQIAEETKRIGQSLAQYKQKFTDQSQKVQAQIGGTATDTERNVVQTLQGAGQSIDQTVGTLAEAARACTEYASQI